MPTLGLRTLQCICLGSSAWSCRPHSTAHCETQCKEWGLSEFADGLSNQQSIVVRNWRAELVFLETQECSSCCALTLTLQLVAVGGSVLALGSVTSGQGVYSVVGSPWYFGDLLCLRRVVGVRVELLCCAMLCTAAILWQPEGAVRRGGGFGCCLLRPTGWCSL